MADSAWSPEHASANDDWLSLKSETAAEAETSSKKKHVGYGVYAGASVAAASLFACVFMAKRKSVQSDDFERA